MPVLPAYQRRLQLRDPSPYYSLPQSRSDAFEAFYEGMNRAEDFNPETQPEYDWLSKALEQGAQTSQLNFESALNASNNAAAQAQALLEAQQQAQQQQFNQALQGAGGSGGAVAGTPRMRAILRALGAQESGNNYGAVNADSGAMGRWQVMPSNIQGPGGWDQEALGRNISTEQFMNNPRLQNQIVRHKFRNYLDQYGLRGALSTWYSGDPNAWNSKDPQGNYPSIHDYVVEVLRRLGLG